MRIGALFFVVMLLLLKRWLHLYVPWVRHGVLRRGQKRPRLSKAFAYDPNIKVKECCFLLIFIQILNFIMSFP